MSERSEFLTGILASRFYFRFGPLSNSHFLNNNGIDHESLLGNILFLVFILWPPRIHTRVINFHKSAQLAYNLYDIILSYDSCVFTCKQHWKRHRLANLQRHWVVKRDRCEDGLRAWLQWQRFGNEGHTRRRTEISASTCADFRLLPARVRAAHLRIPLLLQCSLEIKSKTMRFKLVFFLIKRVLLYNF